MLERLLKRPEYPLFFWFLERYLSGLELVSEVVNKRQGLLLCFREVCIKNKKPFESIRRDETDEGTHVRRGCGFRIE